MYVETVYSATIDNQTVFVKVAEQMETKNDAKIQAMKDVINAFVLPGQQGQIEVKCSPAITSGVPNQQSSSSASSSLMNTDKQSNASVGNNQPSSKSRSSQTCKEPKITNSQIYLLKKTLRGLNRTDADFCQQYHLDRIENLPKEDARWIIRDLLETERR